MLAKSVVVKSTKPGSSVVLVELEVDGAPVTLFMDKIPTADEALAELAKYSYPGPGDKESNLSPFAPPLASIAIDDEFNDFDGDLAALGWKSGDIDKFFINQNSLGFHTYFYTILTADGESLPSVPDPATNVVESTVGTVISQTVPVGPTGTIARKLYRSPAAATNAVADPSTASLVTTISGNEDAAEFKDYTPDSGLGNAPPDEDTSGLEDVEGEFESGVPLTAMTGGSAVPDTAALFASDEVTRALSVQVGSSLSTNSGYIYKDFSNQGIVDAVAILPPLPDGGAIGLGLSDSNGSGVMALVEFTAASGVTVTTLPLANGVMGEGSTPVSVPGFPNFLNLHHELSLSGILPMYSLDGRIWSPADSAASSANMAVSRLVLFFSIPPLPDAALGAAFKEQLLLDAVRLVTSVELEGEGGGGGGGPELPPM